LDTKSRSVVCVGLERVSNGKDYLAQWTLAERSVEGEGIRSVFRAGMIVRHDGEPFEGTVKVQATTKLGLGLFGWPWSGQNPIVVRPSVEVGQGPDVQDFSQLTDEHWATICNFPGPSSVRWR